jgi:hypothetical protein
VVTKEILVAAGVLHRQGRFLKPPEGTYAVYFDDIDSDGADSVPSVTGLPGVYHRTGRIELYEPKPDDETEAALEAELNARSISWSKEDRFWLQDVQRYQTLYELNYTEKRRI